VPNIAGNPAFSDPGLFPAQQDLNGEYFNYNERTGYVGVGTLFLAVVPFIRMRRRFAQYRFIFFGVLLVCGALIYGIFPVYDIAVRLPVLHEINHNRLIFVVAFCLTALAALGFDALLLTSPKGNRSRLRAASALSAIAGAILVVAGIVLTKSQLVRIVEIVSGDPSVAPTLINWVKFWTVLALVLAVATLSVIVASLGDRIAPKLSAAAIVLLVVGDLLVFGARSYAQVSPAELYPQVELTTALKSLGSDARFVAGQDDWHARVPSLVPNSSTAYGIRDFNLYEAVIGLRTRNIFELVNRDGPNRDLPTLLVANYAPDYRTLALLGVTHVLLPTVDAEPPGTNSHLVFQRESDLADQPLPALGPNGGDTQTFVAQTDDLSAVGVYYLKDPGFEGPVQFILKDLNAGTVVQRDIAFAGLANQDWLVVPFAPIAASHGHRFAVSFVGRPQTSGNGFIRFFGDTSAVLPAGQRSTSGQLSPGALRLRLYRSVTSMHVHSVWHDATHSIFSNDDARPRAYVATNVIRVQDAESALAALDRLTVPGRDVVVETSDSIASDGGDASILIDAPGDITVRVSAAAECFLVLNESFGDGGWRAEIDGREAQLSRANYLNQGVAVPAGVHRVHFSYWPRSLTIGLVVSLVTLFIILALAFLGPRIRWQRPNRKVEMLRKRAD